MENNKPVFNSVIVLTITMLVIKVLSAIYRVPYQNVMGDEGLYAYQQVYPIVAIVSVLSINAIPSVISQHDQHGFPYRIMRLLNVVSIVVLIILFVCSPWIARLMGDGHLTNMLRTASLVLLPASFVAVIRGTLQYRNDMRTIAVSQVIDQVLRVGTILLAIVLYTQGLSIYESGMISIFGSFLGILGAWCYLKYKKLPLERGYTSLTSSEVKQFIVLTCFYALSYLIMILWQVVDSFTVLNGLKAAGYTLIEARNEKGIYDRGASLIQMGLILTTSFSLVLIPLLADSRKQGRLKEMNDYASSALKVTIVFSSAAAFGLLNLIRPFNLFLFKDQHEIYTLGIYMLAIIFVSLIIMYTAMLQITEEYRIQALAVCFGLTAKLGLNILLTPYEGVLGAAISTVIGLIVYTVILHLKIRTRYTIAFKHFAVRWMTTLIVMSIVLQLIVHIPYHTRIAALVVSLIGVGVGGMIVAIAMIKFKILTAAEWSYLPFGDKVVRWLRE